MQLTLYIKDLVIAGRHGVHQYEKETPQRFNVTVELALASDKAVTSDDLADTLDWAQLKADIVAIVERKSYNLIERLAQEVASKILENKGVTHILVTIDKLDAFESGVPGVRLEIGRETALA